MPYIQSTSMDGAMNMAKAFASRTLIGTGILYLLDMEGSIMGKLKLSAIVSAGSVASEAWVEPKFIMPPASPA